MYCTVGFPSHEFAPLTLEYVIEVREFVLSFHSLLLEYFYNSSVRQLCFR